MALYNKDASPAIPAAVKIAESLLELQKEIRDDILSRKKYADWSSNCAGLAIGLGLLTIFTPIKIPLLAGVAGLAFLGWVVTKQFKQSLDEGLIEKHKRQEELMIAHEAALSAPAPVPTHALKASSGGAAGGAKPKLAANYNAEAGRIEALEKRLQQLREEMDGKPMPLDKPKSFMSKIGFGS